MDPFTRGSDENTTGDLSTGGWAKPEAIEKLIEFSKSKVLNPNTVRDVESPLRHYHQGCVFLGETELNQPVGWKDDRHMVTIAGSRSGKGRSAIIPNLKLYTGSVLCIDPKGENARETAEHRALTVSKGGLGQEVYVMDPFGVSGVKTSLLATFNPFWHVDLNAIDAIEQVSSIADSMVVPTDPKDSHWDDSARDFIEALILHVLTWPRYSSCRDLKQVRYLLTNGDTDALKLPTAQASSAQIIFPTQLGTSGVPPFETLLESMLQNTIFEGVISGQAQNLLNMGSEERGSVLSTARRNTKFLDGNAIPKNLQKSNHNLTMQRFDKSKYGATVYLCLPAKYMATHSRWLRLILNSFMLEMESSTQRKRLPILTILDEFPILGRMKKLETAVGYMAGFDVKLWTILQDINQIKRDYPDSWETFLGNAGLLQCFGNSDRSTLEYISKNLGEVEVAPIQESTSISEEASQVNLSAEDFKDRLKKKSYFAKLNAELSDFTQNNISQSKQTSSTPQLKTTALMTPDEISREFSRYRKKQILISHDLKPIYINRTNHDEKTRQDPAYWHSLNAKQK